MKKEIPADIRRPDERLIFHIDVNSAFLSWEAARRVAAGEPDLRLVPSAVGGDRENRTGIILAKSIPAKKYGIVTGEPIGMALRKCPDLILARPDFRLYEKNSRAFMDICRKYSPAVEKYSIDECFLDMTGMGLLYPDPVSTAHAIKNEIRDTLGFTVNVGVGPNKLLAKMASDFTKPDRVHTLFYNEISSKMWPLPVRELFGVGRAAAARLEKAYIFTIGDLAHTPMQRLDSVIGGKAAVQLHLYANGQDDSPVSAHAAQVKGYSNSTTLARDITERGDALRILLALSDSVAARMRADGAKAYCISVSIRSNDFHNSSHQKKLGTPTDITDEIYSTACSLFDELWDRRTPLRLLGLALTDIDDGSFVQETLFHDTKKERDRNLDAAVDSIRKIFGADTISRGSVISSGLSSRIGRKHRAQLEERPALSGKDFKNSKNDKKDKS